MRKTRAELREIAARAAVDLDKRLAVLFADRPRVGPLDVVERWESAPARVKIWLLARWGFDARTARKFAFLVADEAMRIETSLEEAPPAEFGELLELIRQAAHGRPPKYEILAEARRQVAAFSSEDLFSELAHSDRLRRLADVLVAGARAFPVDTVVASSRCGALYKLELFGYPLARREGIQAEHALALARLIVAEPRQHAYKRALRRRHAFARSLDRRGVAAK